MSLIVNSVFDGLLPQPVLLCTSVWVKACMSQNYTCLFKNEKTINKLNLFEPFIPSETPVYNWYQTFTCYVQRETYSTHFLETKIRD